MFPLFKRVLVFWLAIGVINLGFPPAASSQLIVPDGAGTAAEAARYEAPPLFSPVVTGSLVFASLQPDTSRTLYVEEEEERNLVKEMIVWIIGAAFVGYFIAKVFLQGDTDEEPPPKSGKQVP